MVLVPSRQPYRFTQAEYLAFERASTERHEYIDGVIYALDGWQSPQAMAGESEAHGFIAGNSFAALHAYLRGGPCSVFTKDMKVRCGPYRAASREGFYVYPDVVVVCGERQYHDHVRDVLLNPTLLIEVLSPSTAAYDLGEKFHGYQRWLPLCTDYLVVAQDTPTIDHYHREADGWMRRTVAGLDASLHVASLDWTVALADVYERVVFQAEAP
jgi:Uma2 family endonuclease